jgi:hypothetical protein
MRLRSVLPHLFASIAEADQEEDALFEACEYALVDIGLDRVVDSIAMAWRTSSWDARVVFCWVLRAIRSQNGFRWCVRLLEEEDDLEMKVHLANAVLDQFQTEGLAPVRDFVLTLVDLPEEPALLANDVSDLRYQLLIMCRIAGIVFPELADLQTEAEQDDYGYSGYEMPRIAENF